MKKIAITGAAGYIGSHLSYKLKEFGYAVFAYDYNFKQNNISFVDKKVEWNISTPIHPLEVDAVVHLAAKTKVHYSVTHPYSYYNTNIIGTANVIDSFKTNHFINCSSGCAFNPLSSPYALSKKAAEDVVKEKSNNFTNLRFYNVSGNAGFFKFDDERYHLIRRAAATANGLYNFMYIYGNDYDTRDGTCIRNYTHISDIVSSIIRSIEHGPMNTDYECLGTVEGYTVNEVIDTMKTVSNVDFPIVVEKRRLGDTPISTMPTKSILFKQEKTLIDQCISALAAEQRPR